MWFMKTSRAERAAKLKSTQLERDEKLSVMKQQLETSFGEMTAIVDETKSCAAELNTRLVHAETDQKPGIIFISHTGKLLFINKLCAAIIQMNDTKSRNITHFYMKDGTAQTPQELANDVFDSQQNGVFDMDKFLFKEPVVLEFDTGELSRPIVLRVTLADTHPQQVSDIIFVCQVSRVVGDELNDLEKAFSATTNIIEIEALERLANRKS